MLERLDSRLKRSKDTDEGDCGTTIEGSAAQEAEDSNTKLSSLQPLSERSSSGYLHSAKRDMVSESEVLCNGKKNRGVCELPQPVEILMQRVHMMIPALRLNLLDRRWSHVGATDCDCTMTERSKNTSSIRIASQSSLGAAMR